MRSLRLALAIFVASLALTAATAPAHADFAGRKLGLGMVVGSPLGFNLKYFIAGEHALETTIGAGFYRGIGFRANLDYNYNLQLFKNGDLTLSMPLGGGIVLGTTDPTVNFFYFAVRPMIGLSFAITDVMEKAPVEIFFMFGPGFGLATKDFGNGVNFGKGSYNGEAWTASASGSTLTAYGFHFDAYFGFRWYVL